MPPKPESVDRRRFLASGLALSAATTATAAEAVPLSVEDQQPFRGQTRRLKITRGSTPLATLIFSTDYPTHFRLKPELKDVCTPSGVPVTGSHEYSFVHHQSIMCGHGRVQADGDDRVVDFYRQLPFPDAERTDRWHRSDKNLFRLGPSGIQRITAARWSVTDAIVIRLKLAWQTRERGREQGDTLAVEERTYRLATRGSSTVVDVFSRLMPAERAVTLLPENDHGYLGARLHDFLTVDRGGRLTDSEGRINATEHFREIASERSLPRWVDGTGNLGTAQVGLTLMSHPGNVRNEWYVREFGLMIVSPAQTEPIRITAERPLEFAARFVAHDGPPDAALFDALYADFAATSFNDFRGPFNELGSTPSAPP